MVNSRDIHPTRFVAARPYFKEYMTFLKRHSRGEETYLSAEDMDQEMTRCIVRQLQREGRLPHLQTAEIKEICQQEKCLLMAIAKFAWYGNNTFVVSRMLCDLLSKTDLDGLRPADLKFPFRSFHIAFQGGLATTLQFDRQVQITGCYVNLYDDSFSLMVAGWALDPHRWYEFEPFAYVSLDLSSPDRPISELLNEWRFKHGDRGE